MKRLLVGNECNLNEKHEKVEERGHTSGKVSVVEEHAHQETEADHVDGIYREIDKNQPPVRVRQDPSCLQD